MSVIFTLPRQIPFNAGALLPGAKLTFSQTGTSTLQNVYQDQARTTPHTNPVVADSGGVFPAIYLDPTLPNYRVKLTTAANVLVYQEDDYPAQQNTQQSMRLESTNPFVFLYDTDGTANARKYRVRAAGNAFEVQASNDAESVFTTILQFTGGVLYSGGTEVAVTSSGSFTGSLTGMTGTTNVTVNWIKNGVLVHMYIASGTTGTSNATSMAMTGLPAAVTPASSKVVTCANLIDNGNTLAGLATIVGAGNSITFSLYRTGSVANRVDANSGLFTNSGSKGIFDGWSITYAV